MPSNGEAASEGEEEDVDQQDNEETEELRIVDPDAEVLYPCYGTFG